MDDTVLIGEASIENIRVMKYILRNFELSSGLKINYSKSSIMGTQVDSDTLAKMVTVLGCEVKEIPFSYL